MDYQEIKESLRKALENPGALTADDKAHVRNVCKELGVYFDPKNARCKSCYQDAAVKCVVECKKRLGDERKTNESGARYILKPGVDVYFGAIRVNEATLTDELAVRIIAQGFDRKFFVKCE